MNNMNDENNIAPETSKDIRLSFALTRTDLFWYNIHFVRLLVIGAITFFILAVGVFTYTLSVPTGDFKTTLIWVVMGCGIGFSLCSGTIAAIVLQVFFLKNESVARAMTFRNYIINEAGVAVFTDKAKIARTWKDVRKVIKTRHGFYIKTGDRIAIVLPRHVFTDKEEIEHFQKLIKLAENH